jgi:hypothetical protein
MLNLKKNVEHLLFVMGIARLSAFFAIGFYQEKTAHRLRVEHCARMCTLFICIVPECMQFSYAFLGVLYLLCLDIHLLLIKIIQTVKRYFFCVGKLFISCMWTLDKKYLCELDWISLHNLSGLFIFGLCSFSFHVM